MGGAGGCVRSHHTESSVIEDTHFVIDLVLVFGTALLGGLVAKRLGQPVILGYIITGILVGPNTPGPSADPEQVELLATIGIAFLMFALGVEFSLGELLRVKKIAIIGGGLQIPFTLALGTGAGYLIGWSWQASLILGGSFALSSSVLVLTMLLRRGEVDTPHGSATLGLMVVQDLALIPMIAFLPVLSGDSENLARTLVISIVVATVALLLVVVLGTRLVPRILYAVARTESRELFLMTIVVIALGTALAAEEAGLSLALGAFLAGLVVSESEFNRAVLSEITPLRDLFSSLFFVAVGMLLVPKEIADDFTVIVLLIAILIAGKLLITGGAMLAAGVDQRTAVLVATTVAQMGEFSFILANEGLTKDIIVDNQYALILAVAVGSIVLTPFVSKSAPPLVAAAEMLPGISGREDDLIHPDASHEGLHNHVVICGYGRVGKVLGESLSRRGLKFAVVELNPAITRELRDAGIPAIYGDAGSEIVLRQAGIDQAKVLVITITDVLSGPSAVKLAKRVNPGIAVISRSLASSDIEVLQEAGSDEIVQPEFEAGLEAIRFVLRDYGVSLNETNTILNHRRAVHYRGGVNRHDADPDLETLSDPLRPPDLDRA